MALPGLPGHPALRPRSPVLAAVREMLGGPQTSFLLIAGQHNAHADRCLGVAPGTHPGRPHLRPCSRLLNTVQLVGHSPCAPRLG